MDVGSAVGRPRRSERGDGWRAFGTAARLGWQMEANWTDPVLFAIYSVAKPVASVLSLVFMVDLIGGGASAAYRAFVVVGSGLWSFVVSGIAGLAWSILDDRERYRMLRYVYVSPSDFGVIVLGRGVARVGVGLIGAVIALGVGFVFLGVGFDPARVDPLLSGVSMVVGLGAVVAIGILMAAVCLQTRQDSWRYPEALAGALFLISGAVFPLSVLPDPVQAVGLVSPLSWWIEGVRRGLLPASPTGIGGSGSLFERLVHADRPDPATIVVALLVTGVVVTLAATLAFRVSERRAKDRGLIDQTTGY
ncbi:MAG: ABC transporter permease [Candidatus Limnocylindrales bacterium]